MASFHKPVAEAIPGIMSLALVGKSFKMIPSFDMISKDIDKPSKKKKDSNKNFIKGSTEILIGIPLIGAVASSIAKL